MSDRREKIFRLSWVYRFVFTWALFLILTLVFLVFPYYHLDINSEFYVISLLVSVLTITIILFSFEINVDLTFDDSSNGTDFHNVNAKLEEDLINNYYNEKPINIGDKNILIPASFIWNFDKGITIDNLITVKSGSIYNLPNEFLINRSRIIRATLNRPRKEFYPYDKICICLNLEEKTIKDKKNYIFHVNQATLADEYATIQNPDDDLSFANFKKNKTVRTIVSNDSFLPPLHRENKLESNINLPYRLAMHVLIETSDGYFILQKRSSKHVATSAGEITSSAGGGMDWRDYSRGHDKGIQKFVFREIREETTLSRSNFIDLKVRSVIREFRRLGQPVIVLTGKINLSYQEVIRKIEKSKRYARSPWLYPYWYFWTSLVGKSGREYWEMDGLMSIKYSEIAELIDDPIVQPPTKIALSSILEEKRN